MSRIDREGIIKWNNIYNNYHHQEESDKIQEVRKKASMFLTTWTIHCRFIICFYTTRWSSM